MKTFEKPILKDAHPDLIEYDNGVAYFIKDLGFCCDNPWDYLTNDGENPQYWNEFDTAYDAIEHYLEDRGWRKILKKIDRLEKKIEVLGECAEFYRDENRESWSYDQSSQKCPAMLNGDDIEWCEKEKGFRGGMVARQTLAKLEAMEKEG